MNSTTKNIIVPFLVGGGIISGVKFAATSLHNPALSAIIGGIPSGLLAIYFLKPEKSIRYSQTYFFVNLALAVAILTFYLLRVKTNIPKNNVLLISIFVWCLLVWLQYLYETKNS